MRRQVHLGPGAFFRAHGAWYTARAGGWRITGISLRSPSARDLLKPTGFAYDLLLRDADGTTVEHVDVLDDILVAPEDPARALAALTDPATHLVTLTVTEKGYALAPDGTLDLAHPEVAADLSGRPPLSVPGLLAHALARRTAPLTVLSCDNLPGNGPKLEAATRAFAAAAGLTLAAPATFPGSMVDRITPAATPALAEEAEARTGRPGAAAIETETFTEWVIEDRFAAPRPAWERAGATLTADVAPHERRKLRMLNGAHSTLAYLGPPAGHAHVHEAIADPALRAAAAAVMDAAARTLDLAPGDAAAYRDALLRRFENPGLRHRLLQIAMDGSQKVPIRLLAPARDLHERGHDTAPHIRGVAAWVRFVTAQTDAGTPLDDPRAADLAAAARAPDPARALLHLIAPDLPPALADAIAAQAGASHPS